MSNAGSTVVRRQLGVRLRRLRTAAGKTERDVERMVALRRERQQTLTDRTPPLRFTAVLGAGALTRQVGDRATMAEQADRLRHLTALDHVDIRVIPWNAGAHAAIHLGPFTFFDFPDPDDPPVVYLETQTGARYLEKPLELAEYRRIYDLIYEKSMPIEEFSP